MEQTLEGLHEEERLRRAEEVHRLVNANSELQAEINRLEND
jgi:hypothetical protein